MSTVCMSGSMSDSCLFITVKVNRICFQPEYNFYFDSFYFDSFHFDSFHLCFHLSSNLLQVQLSSMLSL